MTRERVSEMILDSNGLLVKTIKDRLVRWKKCFEGEFNASDIALELIGEPAELEIISVIQKLTANK